MCSCGPSKYTTARVFHPLKEIFKLLELGVMGIAIVTAVTGYSSAQPPNCPTLLQLVPGGVTAPSWWVFETNDEFNAQVGIFRASIQPPNALNPFPRGVINGTMSYNNPTSMFNPLVIRAAFTGTFTVDANDCSRSTVSFMINGNSFQYTAVLADTGISPTAFQVPLPLAPTSKLFLLSR